MSSPSYGHATRAVSSPIASGQRGRFSQPTKYLPLSQFFQQGEPAGGKVIYGRQEPSKKKVAKGAAKTPPKEEKPAVAQESSEDFCDYGGGYLWNFIKKNPRYDTEEFREFVACKNKADRDSGELGDIAAHEIERLAKAFESMTTTANVPTVPVPIGAGDGRKFLDRPGDKDKKKKKRDLSARMGLLLRRLF